MAGRTLYEKLWDSHRVVELDEQSTLLYIDRHLLHEVTSPQAFAGLQAARRPLWRVGANLATEDHNIPTVGEERKKGAAGIKDATARLQVETLEKNCEDYQVTLFTTADARQGIVHVMGPEQGATLPGMTIVCGDSHTSTHGAFAALAHGIGTSEVEHVLATQCLVQRKLKSMQVYLTGKIPKGVGAKDIVLALIGQIGTAGGTNHAIEFCGPVISELSMEARMTLCNMAIEAGARVGLIAVDEITINYLKNRPYAPTPEQWQEAEKYWRTLVSDPDAQFNQRIRLEVSDIAPQVTWGTSPEMVTSIYAKVPDPALLKTPEAQLNCQKALDYMGLVANQPMNEIFVDHVFIGSCTNGRIEDLRQAAEVLRNQKIAGSIKQALVVPGSGLVKQQAEAEGLDKIFIEAGFEWREPGCSMCLAMNADKLKPGERCASTSNRNFQGRQGFGSRTHLVSPAMAAAAAIAGHFIDVRSLLETQDYQPVT